jgi:hypothetical protein
VDAEAGAATLEADAVRVSAMMDPTGGCCREDVDPVCGHRGRTVEENFMEAAAVSNFPLVRRCNAGPGYWKLGLERPYNTPPGSESVTALSSWRMWIVEGLND